MPLLPYGPYCLYRACTSVHVTFLSIQTQPNINEFLIPRNQKFYFQFSKYDLASIFKSLTPFTRVNLFSCTKPTKCSSRWPLACMGLRVRIPSGYGYLYVVSVVYCQVEVCVSSRSLVQRSPTDCGVSECDHEASIMGRPWPNSGCFAVDKPTKCIKHKQQYNLFSLTRVSAVMFHPHDVLKQTRCKNALKIAR